MEVRNRPDATSTVKGECLFNRLRSHKLPVRSRPHFGHSLSKQRMTASRPVETLLFKIENDRHEDAKRTLDESDFRVGLELNALDSKKNRTPASAEPFGRHS